MTPTANRQGGSLNIVSHLLRHRTSVFVVSSKGPPYLAVFYDKHGVRHFHTSRYWERYLFTIPSQNVGLEDAFDIGLLMSANQSEPPFQTQFSIDTIITFHFNDFNATTDLL